MSFQQPSGAPGGGASAEPPRVRPQSPRAAFQRHVKPKDGIVMAQSDMHNFLQQSHGTLFDEAMKYAESVGIQRDQVSYLIFALAAVYLIFGSAARLLCNLIGFGYPTYASVLAIRTKGTDDDTVWLIYWTCFAVLYLVDFFSEFILSFFPFYYILKACFLVYLYLPQTQGSVMFYDNVVDPLVFFVDQKLDEYYYNKKKVQ
uniref:Receptor expression-enhancing protein n=1 Tax=Caenorhabditis tropicalis TaxID=1561998 RepID=A0A1I7UZ19_9PELO